MQTLWIGSDVHGDVDALEQMVRYATAQGVRNSRLVVAGDLSLRAYTLDQANRYAAESDQALEDAPDAFRGAQTAFKSAARDHNVRNTLGPMKTILERSGMPFNVIPGNYDHNFTDVFGAANLHLASTRFGGAKVFGYGGADEGPGHLWGNKFVWNGIDVRIDMRKLLEICPFDHDELYGALVREQPDIAIVHNPPLGLCDDMFDGNNVGTHATRKFMLERLHARRPLKLGISGHVHEAGPNGNNPHHVAGINGLVEGALKTVVVNPGNLGRYAMINKDTLAEVRAFPYGTFIRVDCEDDGTPRACEQYSLTPQTSLNTRSFGAVRQLRRVTF
ncbi:metallophosphoesterase family protein [Candidatus Woesearchaeota archaeon]|nr:metallophosphoesterase family protein [Candidatus Woesearchaeota archaeon]